MVLARNTMPTSSASTMRRVCLKRQTSILPRRIAHIALTKAPSTPNASSTLSSSQLPKREPTQLKPSQRMSSNNPPLTNSTTSTTGMNIHTRAITAFSMRFTVVISTAFAAIPARSLHATAPTKTMTHARCHKTITGYQAAIRRTIEPCRTMTICRTTTKGHDLHQSQLGCVC